MKNYAIIIHLDLDRDPPLCPDSRREPTNVLSFCLSNHTNTLLFGCIEYYSL